MSVLIPFARRATAIVPKSNLLSHYGSTQVVTQFPFRRCFSAPSEEPSEKIVNIVDELCTLNVVEMNQLVELFKEKVGLSGVDMMPQMMMGGGMPQTGAGPAEAAAVEEVKVEKDIFDVKLASFDAANKIKVIKEVRAITGLGLKEAKELVEGAPKIMKKDMSKKDAEEIVEKLKAVGGVVELE